MNQSAEKITNLKTELYSFHIANGGKMVPFAGYDMPVNTLRNYKGASACKICCWNF